RPPLTSPLFPYTTLFRSNPPMTRAKRAFSSFLPLLLGCAALPGCAGNSWVELGGQRYAVEVADDPEERARGLMFRDELAAGTGRSEEHTSELQSRENLVC